MDLIMNDAGNYKFLRGISPYSCGVTASPGFEIIHCKLRSALPLADNTFNFIENFLQKQNRPVQALCAMELRIPAPLSFAGFKDLNDRYRDMLAGKQLLLDGLNPLARTNIAMKQFDTAEASVYAFSFTAPISEDNDSTSFIVAGAGDLIDQTDLSETAIVRPNDTSSEGMQEKAAVVLKVMRERLEGLQAKWSDLSNIDIYTTSPLDLNLSAQILKGIESGSRHGLHWYFGQPPIQGLAFEMDMRGVQKEIIIHLK